jgi:trehalose synthase
VLAAMKGGTAVQEVAIHELPVEQLADVLPPDRMQRFVTVAARAKEALAGRVVWNVNSTAAGGGVAEMLQTLLASARGAGVDARWLVFEGDPEFFAITKRIHNLLHGEPGDGRGLSDADRAHYEQVQVANLADLRERISPQDLILLHDPQPAGMLPGLRDSSAPVVWRCHVGRDEPNQNTDMAWAFLRPYVETADALVFSRERYAPDWVDRDRLLVVPPSIDPFSSKNRDLEPQAVVRVLATAGLLTGVPTDGPVPFVRRDGAPGEVRPHEGVLQGGEAPPNVDDKLVVQVSRWDRLKDMAGVMAGFVQGPATNSDAHLMLAGPAVAGVADDPEGAEVLEECLAAWCELPESLRKRVHLAAIPMDDPDENAVIINALQRHAAIVVQKSIVEGFGLTVAEAMWKARPVVATAVGGIQDQITHERTGLLLDDPRDLAGLGEALSRLLDDPDLAHRLGEAGRAAVLDRFLGDRHLEQYAALFGQLLAEPAHT